MRCNAKPIQRDDFFTAYNVNCNEPKKESNTIQFYAVGLHSQFYWPLVNMIQANQSVSNETVSKCSKRFI